MLHLCVSLCVEGFRLSLGALGAFRFHVLGNLGLPAPDWGSAGSRRTSPVLPARSQDCELMAASKCLKDVVPLFFLFSPADCCPLTA